MKKQLFLGLGALALLASCSNDHDGLNSNIYDGYLHVNGTINEIKTRATDTGFDSGDQIGVSVYEGETQNVNYTFNGTNFTATSPIKLSEETTFVAYYPYSEDFDTPTWKCSVVDKDNAPLPNNQIDFLFAKATASKENPVANFAFNHQMAQISLTINDKTEEQVYKNQTASVTLNKVAVEFYFWPEDGLVESGNPNGTIKLASVAVGTAKTIIVPSEQDSPYEDPIEVVVTIDGKGFQGQILPRLKPGNRYSYTLNITDAESSLTVGDSSVSDWKDNKEEDIEMGETEAPYELAVGDFLLKDGTTVAPTTENATQDVVGVVYYVGNPQLTALYPDKSYDNTDVLKNDYPNAIHGLAIALKNVEENSIAFGKNINWNISTSWFKAFKNGVDGETYGEGFVDIASSSLPSEMKGYNNSEIIKKAVKDLGQDETDATGFKAAADLLTTYNSSNAVSGSNLSSWYIPSYAELNVIMNHLSVIQESLKKTGSNLEVYTDLDVSSTKENFYWTSDTRNAKNQWVHTLTESIQKGGSQAELSESHIQKNYKGQIRMAIAF